MIRGPKKKIAAVLKWYKRKKIPYIFEIQNETITIKSQSGSFVSRSSEYEIDELNFIKSVKQYVIKNDLQEKFRRKYTAEGADKKVKYFHYSSRIKPGDRFDNVINIDLSSAYWETANQFGLLSPELYKAGLKVRKQVRLAAIGSLAKKVRVYKFDGRKLVALDKKISDKTHFLWPAICDHVGKLLVKTAKLCGDGFIFFWVDGIYVKKGYEQKVYKAFKAAGYKYSVNDLKAISVTEKYIYVHLLKPEKMEIDGKEAMKIYKQFPYRTQEQAEKFKGYNIDL